MGGARPKAAVSREGRDWIAKFSLRDDPYNICRAELAAMTLATAQLDGTPLARIVLLRGFDDRGFEFYTNYQSRKGDELAANPRAALVLFWAALQNIGLSGSAARTET